MIEIISLQSFVIRVNHESFEIKDREKQKLWLYRHVKAYSISGSLFYSMKILILIRSFNMKNSELQSLFD